MSRFGRVPRAILGAAIGMAVVAFGVWAAGQATRDAPLAVLLVLAVTLTGLLLGSEVAAGVLLGGVVTFAAVVIIDPNIIDLSTAGMARGAALLAGSPVIVYLVWRAEVARRERAAAHAALERAEAEAAEERARIDEARRTAGEALERAQRERARLEEVAESIPEPLIVYDGDLRGTYANRAALRLFGRSFVERAPDEWARSTEPRDPHGRALEREDWPQVRAQREAIRMRLLVRIPMSGRDVLVDVEGTPIRGGGAVLLLRDVGKEEDERRRLSQFASFVAHELRNPLAVAKARIELAQRDPTLSSRASSHASRALESTDAAIDILERLELYSRADTGRVEAASEPFELAPALGSAIERVRARGSDRDVRVTLAPGIRVMGDRQLTVQAITNLVSNADRYSTSGAPIHVEVDAGEMVVLRVRDEGPGIEDAVADRLFHDRVAAGRGLGLGLYLVHASMEAMGGSVALEQRRPCAVFALRWPAAPAE